MRRSWGLVFALVLAGCGGDGDDDGAAGGAGGAGGGHDHDSLAAACDHFEYGPFVPIQAAAEATGDLPDVSLAHHRYDVTLATDAGGQHVAFLKFAADEAKHTWFLPNEDVPVALLAADGTPVALEAASAAEIDCDAAAKAAGAELEPGTYTLRLGPTTQATLQLVVHAVEDGADHDDAVDETDHHH